jgi:FkbM family methyltransferase
VSPDRQGLRGVRDNRTEKVPFGKSDGFRRFKLSLKRLIGREPRFSIDERVPLENFGVWQVCPDLLPSGGVVYSLGVGEDIDFDLAMIRLKGMEVHAFDPTPNSIEWLERQDMPGAFHFHAWAVADQDGSFFLYPRLLRDGRASTSMYTLLPQAVGQEGGIEVPAKTLATIAETLGHRHVDVLKMDIEGAEYGVLVGLLDSDLRPTQLLVEFHHRHTGLDKAQTVRAVANLRSAGYALVDISSTGREFSFVHETGLEKIGGR